MIDKKHFLFYYVILMTFISVIVYLDGTMKVNVYNIVYINILAFVCTMIYLLVDYYSTYKYYNEIRHTLDNDEGIHSLPEPEDFKQSLTNRLVTDVYKNQQDKIQTLYGEKRANLEFVTSWVHEIKTPISVIRLLIEDSCDESKEVVLSSIEEEIDKIDNYVEQTLYYSRIDDFSKDYFISDYDLEEIVKSSISKHAKIFISKRIKVEIRNLDLYISTDKKWLSFIIDQILINSLKYTGINGIIRIYAEKNDNEKILFLEDNGIGIKEEDIGRVFDRGFTGHNGRGIYKSTGMGLYLAKELAGKLGHKITAESSYGNYTKVKIHFPKLTDYFDAVK